MKLKRKHISFAAGILSTGLFFCPVVSSVSATETITEGTEMSEEIDQMPATEKPEETFETGQDVPSKPDESEQEVIPPAPSEEQEEEKIDYSNIDLENPAGLTEYSDEDQFLADYKENRLPRACFTYFKDHDGDIRTVLIINEEGTYGITGDFTGSILISPTVTNKVDLYLNGTNIHTNDGTPVVLVPRANDESANPTITIYLSKKEQNLFCSDSVSNQAGSFIYQYTELNTLLGLNNLTGTGLISSDQMISITGEGSLFASSESLSLSSSGLMLNGGFLTAFTAAESDISENSKQCYMQLGFETSLTAGSAIMIQGMGYSKNFISDGEYSYFTISDPEMSPDTYNIFLGDSQQAYGNNCPDFDCRTANSFYGLMDYEQEINEVPTEDTTNLVIPDTPDPNQPGETDHSTESETEPQTSVVLPDDNDKPASTETEKIPDSTTETIAPSTTESTEITTVMEPATTTTTETIATLGQDNTNGKVTYKLNITSESNKIKSVTLNSNKTLKELTDALGYTNVKTWKIKQAKVEEYTVQGSVTMGSLVKLMENGDLLVIGYASDGTIVGSALTKRTAKSGEFDVVLSKNSSSQLRTEKEVENILGPSPLGEKGYVEEQTTTDPAKGIVDHPKTGDTMSTFLWCGIGFAAVTIIGLILYYLHKTEETETE